MIIIICSHAVRAAEENSQSLMSLQQIRQVQRTAGSKEELLFDAGYFSSAASKNKVTFRASTRTSTHEQQYVLCNCVMK